MMKAIQKHCLKRESVRRKKVQRAIRQDLMKKGIDKNLQQEVLETFGHEEQLEACNGTSRKSGTVAIRIKHRHK